MKERQRWQAEEDNVLREYVKQYGPRDWHLVSERMGTTLDRDAKSCVERWKNYLKPDIKKGSLTEEEQQLVISLQAKYGNKWKKIAAEVPGRTAKRLGKWWEAYKDKQQKEKEKDRPRFAASGSTGETSNYSEMLATLADKFGQQQQHQGSTMLPHPTFPTASLLAPPPIVPLALLGPSIAGGTSNPTSVGILIPKLPSFEMLPSHPLVTVAFPVPVMTTAIGSWLSTAITVPQCASLSTATAEPAVEIIPVRVSSSRASEGHPATIVPARTTQGPAVTVVSEGSKATSQPATTSAGTSALPPWMSIVPSSAAQTPAVGSDWKSFATTPTLPLTLLGPSSSASREVPSSTSGDIVTSSIPPSDPTSTVLAQRAWLQATMSRMEAGPSARNIPNPGVGVSTQALWAAANLQQTHQIGPSAAPMPVPEMALSASHWVQLLQFCKELEDRHQYWFAQKKESSWRLKRLEAKLEAEKMQQRKQKMEDVNASIATLRKEESQFLEGLEADYKEKVSLISLALST
jgi:hypothetical protein